MGESTIQLINDGGIVVFALFILIFAATALHRGWAVPGKYYDQLKEDHDALKVAEKESNEVKRELVSALSTLTDEVRTMRREIKQ